MYLGGGSSIGATLVSAAGVGRTTFVIGGAEVPEFAGEFGAEVKSCRAIDGRYNN